MDKKHIFSANSDIASDSLHFRLKDENFVLENATENYDFDLTKHLSLDLLERRETIHYMKHMINKFENHHLNSLKEWEVLSKKIQATLHRIETVYQKTVSTYEMLDENRLRVIQQQKKALSAFKLATLKAKIRAFFRPRIGTLYQHEARPLLIPARYKKLKTLTNTPTVSIVTPSYNQAHFLTRTIQSVIGQQYPALEYIIQDGNSTDDSVKVMEKFTAFLKHWESVPDNGQSHAINLGFQHATGEIMAYLNSDDILLPGTINYVVDYFNQHPDVDVVYGHRVLIDEHDHEVGRWVLPPHDNDILIWADYIPQETLFWRRSIWEKTGGKIDESYKFAMDWELLLRFKKANAKFVRLPRFLGAFRIHENQKTSSQMSIVGMKEMDRLRTNYHGHHICATEIRQKIRRYQIKHVIYNKLYRFGLAQY